jgi:PAS domain S-box-containing protein
MPPRPPPPPPPDDPPDPGVYKARLEAVLESVSDGFYALDSDWRYVVFNRAAEEYFGVSRDRLLGRVIWDVFPQGRGTRFERHCRAAMEKGETRALETPSALRPDRIVEVRTAPMRGGGISVSLTDVTERRLAEDAVKAALARSESILESISDAFYAVDSEWRFTYVNRVAEGWWDRSREALLGRSIWDVFPETVDTPTFHAHLKSARTRRVVRAEFVSPVLERWIDASIFPTESGLAVYFRDITERKLAEERQRLLVNELNHRVKNALATVQAIAAQSLRSDEVPPEARARFTERLMALARANDVLVAGDWQGASLAAVAAQVASPYADAGDDGRFVAEGPAVQLSANAATAMALALHELATNAAKYGALSWPEGRVELTWRIEGEGETRRFGLTWRESDGPPVTPPRTTGFGTRLIERGLAAELRATVAMDYAPTGLVCTLSAPLSEALSAP